MQNTISSYDILVINPGSTSTKVAVFRETQPVYSQTIIHSTHELSRFSSIADQQEFRIGLINSFLETHGVERIDAIACRGGLLRPLPGGVYNVTSAMLDDCAKARYGEHASNLGALLGKAMADRFGCKAYIADPVVVDEMDPVARLSGIPDIERKSIFHALNQKSAARIVARQLGREYEECNFIVAHFGGGVSVGAHCRGRVIDVNNALDGDGPFSAERAGGVPVSQVLSLLETGRYTAVELHKRLVGKGGLFAYCQTTDLQEIRKMIESGNIYTKNVFDAMAYQISKEIAMHGATLSGCVDGIILTGGMANDTHLVDAISSRVSFLAPIFIIPGEREMEALATNILRVLRLQQTALDY